MDVFVEIEVGGHIDDAVQAWAFDLASWGRCGQGTDEVSAVAALQSQLGVHAGILSTRERIHGDEQAFDRDRRSATRDERNRTTAILREVRPRTIEVLESCTREQLDWVDPDRQLPSWATWNTLRRMGWHILDTESRYYLERLGFGMPRASEDLFDELRHSADNVARAIDRLPPGLVVETDEQVWTTTKVLRRLAWHERAELNVVQTLATRAAAALGFA